MKVTRWMSIVFVAVLALGCTAKNEVGDLVKLQGAGASFPAPLYSKWFKAYSESHKNVQIDYQSVGSGSGVKSFMDKTVDFGASDAAMTPDEMSQVDGRGSMPSHDRRKHSAGIQHRGRERVEAVEESIR